MSKKDGNAKGANEDGLTKDGLEMKASPANPADGAKKGSILKVGGVKKGQDPRTDSYGNQIKKGGKKHKILFKAEISNVNEVENWKQYNLEEDNTGKKCCSIF
jgi:hypothetical protein